MNVTARLVSFALIGVLLSLAAGYGLAKLDESQAQDQPPTPPLSVVCSAALGSLDRLSAHVAEPDPAERVTAAPVDAEITVLSQQRLRLDREGLDAPRQQLSDALDASLLELARAQQRLQASDLVDAGVLRPAVADSVARVRAACPAP